MFNSYLYQCEFKEEAVDAVTHIEQLIMISIDISMKS